MADRGLTVTDADGLVAELYRPGQPGALAVAELFGSDVLDARGGVDHQALAALVFADPEARRRLEGAIHPLVGARFEELASQTPGIVVFEATLLVETEGYRRFDALVTVEADDEVRVRRAVERGLDEAAARSRLAAQASSQERIAVADFVIWNEGALGDLEAQVDRLVAALARRLH